MHRGVKYSSAAGEPLRNRLPFFPEVSEKQQSCRKEGHDHEGEHCRQTNECVRGDKGDHREKAVQAG